MAEARSNDPFIGREVLNGELRILQRIGTGGMGSVYRAEQPEMNRMVAIKIQNKESPDQCQVLYAGK